MKIFIDIETIPNQDPNALSALIEATKADFHAPSDLSKEQAAKELLEAGYSVGKYDTKPTVIKQWEEVFANQKAPEVAEKAWRKTALNGGYGQIYCIGVAMGYKEPFVIQKDNEKEMLQCLFAKINEALKELHSHHGSTVFIGHNVEWDLRFLYQRCVIQGVEPTVELIHSKYSPHVFDTMQTWAGFGNRISLDELCQILNIPTPKQGIDGSQVWDFVQQGKGQEVMEYCRRDVAAVQAIYRRMTYQAAP